MVKYQDYIVERHVPGDKGEIDTANFGRVEIPNKAVCRYCGGLIARVPYGSGLRWEHTTVISGVRIASGIFCQTTIAAPDRRRQVRNRYALRPRRRT